MSYITVDVDVNVSDFIDQIDDKELLREVENREIKMVSPREKEQTLLTIADYCRSEGRNDYAFRLDEIRGELVE